MTGRNVAGSSLQYNRLMLPLLFLLILSHSRYGQASSATISDAVTSARALFKQGKFHEAAAAYRAVVEKDKSSAAVYSGLVQSYLQADDIPAADEASEQALKVLPQSGLAHAIRGDVYFRKGLLADAETQYRTAVEQDEKCARAWLGMGKIYSTVSRQEQAKEAFAKAHTLDPDDGDAWYRWAVLLPFPRSVNELEKHLAEFRSTPDEERHEREFIDLLKGIGNREVWAASKDSNQTEIKLETVTPRPGIVVGLGLRAKFNDSASSTLLLDTGATWVTISRKLAEKIGARKISDYGLEGVGSSAPAAGYFAWVDKITLGEVEFHDCVVHVRIKDDLDGPDGLVGANIFARYLVTIDFPAHKLRLGPLPQAPPSASETLVHPFAGKADPQAFNFGHIFLLPAHVNRSTALFVLDTGANTSSITPDFARAAGKPHEIRESVTGSNGVVNKVFVLEDAVLQFSSIPESASNLLA
ncbi:MAG TPA: aspartyl protease family protein, partial [Candidatus Angelobacter sp.]